MKRTGNAILLWGLILLSFHAMAQDGKQRLANANLIADSMKHSPADTLPAVTTAKSPFLKHDPRIATRRSAIIPGWGQAYNREYWKIPLVYGILAIPVGLFIYNNDYYNKTKFAYEARYKELYSKDSTDIPFIDPQLKNLSIHHCRITETASAATGIILCCGFCLPGVYRWWMQPFLHT